jgi:tetrapyrrole methylase family protein/MazG family protein
MDDVAGPAGAAASVIIAGLGPGDLDRLPRWVRAVLTDAERRVIVRTLEHPAAVQLAALRPVESCDDLYRSLDEFDDVYVAIADRVEEASKTDSVVYAVPGSPLVGEFAVPMIRERLSAEILPAESFVDAVLSAMGVDPLSDGFQLLNGHDLPQPLVIDKPTVIGHLDAPQVLADALARLDRVLAEDGVVTLTANLGSADEVIISGNTSQIDVGLAGVRTSLFVNGGGGGLAGVVGAMRRLRIECPWDRKQTHQSLGRYLIEETFELAEALAGLPEVDWQNSGAYADVEEELGDVLLQVLFHAAIAAEEGVFDIDDVAEQLRRKLVRRHPHVFGDVEAEDAETVKANWDAIKADEKGAKESALDGIPSGLPGLSAAAETQRRAAKVGFDWSELPPVLEKVREELSELEEAIATEDGVMHELGDLLFSVVNLSRHLELDAELVIRGAVQRFSDRFHAMEAAGSLEGLSLQQLDARWEQAKDELDSV